MTQTLSISDKYYFEVTKLLSSFKIPCDKIGYDYLRTAVLGCLEFSNLTKSMTKNLYPYIAQKFNTNVHHVERNIRNVIQKAYENNGLLMINEYIGFVVYQNEYKFTNSEMIHTFLEIMRNHIKRRELETFSQFA